MKGSYSLSCQINITVKKNFLIVTYKIRAYQHHIKIDLGGSRFQALALLCSLNVSVKDFVTDKLNESSQYQRTFDIYFRI